MTYTDELKRLREINKELYESCQAIQDSMNRHGASAHDWLDSEKTANAFRKMREALAKAAGENQ